MHSFIKAKQQTLIIAAVLLGLLILMVLPPLLFAPDIKDKDFPHSGEVVRLTDTGFVIGGKHKERELTITTTATTTVRGDVTVGEFVQVFGTMVRPGEVVAERIQVIDGPRRQNRDTE